MLNYFEILLDPSNPWFWINLLLLIFLVEAVPFLPIHLEALLLTVLLITTPWILWLSSVIALSCGTAVSYVWTKKLAKTKWMQKQLQRKNIMLIKEYFIRYGDPFLIIIRTIPVIPYRSINIIAGPLEYPFKRYMIISIITAMIRLGIIIFGTSLLIEFTGNKLLTIIVVIIVLTILSLVSGIYLRRVHIKYKQENLEDQKKSHQGKEKVAIIVKK